MEEVEKRKEIEKVLQKPSALKRKELLEDSIFVGSEKVEIKRLDEEDLEEVVKVMRKALFEIGAKEMKEMKEIIKQNSSYGAYVERFLVGVGLAWPIYFDRTEKTFNSEETPNAMYMEEVAILLDYQGKGIIEMLIEEREKEAKQNGLEYVVGICGTSITGDIRNEIEQGGTMMQKKYLSLNYRFANTDNGLIAFKKV